MSVVFIQKEKEKHFKQIVLHTDILMLFRPPRDPEEREMFR